MHVLYERCGPFSKHSSMCIVCSDIYNEVVRTNLFHCFVFLTIESIVLTPVESTVVGAYQRPYTITCRGDNIRSWQWIRNNAKVTNSSNGRVQVWSNGRLHFTSLRYSDAGIYYCKAANFFENKYATYRLTVNGVCMCLCVCVRVYVCACVGVFVYEFTCNLLCYIV